MNKSVYFFDERQHLIRIVKEGELLEVIQEKEITVNKDELMNDSLTVTTVYDKELKTASYMAVKETTSSYSMYKIITDNERENMLNFVGISFAPDELDAYILKNIEVNKSSVRQVLKSILNDTEWEIGTLSPGLPLITEDFSFLSIREALKKIQVQGCEVVFTYKIDGIGITKKQINVYKEIGKVSNQRFTYGEKALSIEKEQDRNQIYTSLIGRGRGEDVGDGKGKRLEFTSIEWNKSNGDPVDKPKGQNWLELPEMTEFYGIPLKNGGMRKREKVIVFDEDEDPKTLLQHTYEALVECSRPLIQFKTEVLGGDAIGNKVTIHRHDRNYHYQTRIFKVKVDRLTEKVEAGLGDNITRNMSKSTADLKTNVDSLEEKKMTFYDSEEISKWQDDILRGAGKNGGSVYQVNGIEAGISNSREVYETIFMDGPNVEKSAHFMIQNSDGISFKKCTKGQWKSVKDIHNGKSKTAWGLDGTFNADFITAGTIRGRKIEGCEFRTLDNTFQIKIMNGTITFSDKSADKVLGTISATLSDGKVNGFAVIQKPGFIFSLNSAFSDDDNTSQYVLQIPENSSAKEPKINSRGVWKHYGDLHLTGRLFLNGREISGNGSGGNINEGSNEWDGSYPSEVITDAEKFAWQAWVTLHSLGYSKAAAAGILGNINGEAGSTMNPDTVQYNGPAYGAVQFDGSRYPLIGEPTTNGREYFQRLHNASGVGGSYKEMVVQMKVVDWSTRNGQWIGKVAPTKIDEFKHIQNPEQAAYAFENNFERPEIAHNERQGYAKYWYDKFVNLSINLTKGSRGLAHLESLYRQRLGNGQCYAVSAEYSGFLGGCGLGSGTGYPISHNIGNTVAAADIGSSYNWSTVGWKVIYNPSYNQLVTGAIVNWKRGGNIGGFNVHNEYGHTGVIRDVANGGFLTYEQNIGLGQVVGKYERPWVGSSEISSIVIPPN